MTGPPDKTGIRVARQTLTPPRPDLLDLVMSTADGLELIGTTPPARGREQVIVLRGLANMLPLLPLYVIVTNV